MQPRKWSPPAIEPSQGPIADPSGALARSPRLPMGCLGILRVVHVLYGVLRRHRGLVAVAVSHRSWHVLLHQRRADRVGVAQGRDTARSRLARRDLRNGLRVGGRRVDPVRPLEGLRARVDVVVAAPNVHWSVIAGAALGCAVLKAISTAFVRRVLPWFGIEIARDSLAWTITEGLVGFATLGLLFLLLSTSAVPDWLGSH
jgi:hypothetical protein